MPMLQYAAAVQAGCVGRSRLMSTSDLPGPGHYTCSHNCTDRHVPSTKLAQQAHARPATPISNIQAVAPDEQHYNHHHHHQQQREGQGTAATGPLRGLVGRRLHPRAPPRKGTSAFLSVSRAQLDKRNRALLPQPAVGAAMAASEAPAGGDGSAVLVLDPDCHYWEGYDHLTRPSSRGPVAE